MSVSPTRFGYAVSAEPLLASTSAEDPDPSTAVLDFGARASSGDVDASASIAGRAWMRRRQH